MPLYYIRTDLTKFKCDAIVLSADSSLLNGGGVFGAAASVGGNDFFLALRALKGCALGLAKSFKNSRFPCEHIIVTAAPTWKDGKSGEIRILTACYINSLEKALSKGCKKVAVNLIDSRIYGFPSEIAQIVAVESISSYLETHDMDVYLVSFDYKQYGEQRDTSKLLERFLDDYYNGYDQSLIKKEVDAFVGGQVTKSIVGTKKVVFGRHTIPKPDLFKISKELEERLKERDESFSTMLFRKIDELGIKDSDCYTRAHISKQVFSKIRCKNDYRPTKQTVLALAVALELSLEETVEMLRKAGFAFSQNSCFDIIVTFFIQNQIYDIGTINEYLYQYDQSLLGYADK